ncbi:pectinesterase inhibitor 6 [Humulus lupulus]|uniref:pectinesterase inhibitor 6 n=1 Tax=Humulus lupulus TaxID=3486 RepID=UPI002B405F17|nr:pectinesterase inhibitor 6 [Humulus lupulus]
MALKLRSQYSVVITLLVIFRVAILATAHNSRDDKYVRDACSVTRYRSLCIRSLAPFSSAAKDSPVIWARAGVSVTLSEAKGVALYLMKLNRNNNGTRSGRRNYYKAALSDCVELFENAVDELHQSLRVMRNLSKRTFGTQLGDLNTWLSAALTDADTCLEGLKRGRYANPIRAKVSRTSYTASNALALVNKLAATGVRNLPDP